MRMFDGVLVLVCLLGHVGGIWEFGFVDVVECFVVAIWWCAV